MPGIVDVPRLLADASNFTERQWLATWASNACQFLLFGGAKGPGKSRWLRWHALMKVCELAIPLELGGQGFHGVRALVATSTYRLLYDRQIVKVLQEFPDWLGYWHGGAHEYRVKKKWGGGVVVFRNLDNPSNYQGQEYAFIGVDELTEMPSPVFNGLRGALRWPGLDVARFAGATNPTGRYMKWVRDLWIERKFPPELAPQKAEFGFLAGRPKDNPYLSPDYWQMLKGLPGHLRKAWVEGDWYAGVEGQVYPNFGPENIGEQWDYRPGVPVFWACDDGWSPDPRVILFCHEIGPNEFVIFDEYYVNYEVSEESIHKALETFPYPKPQVAALDPTMVEFASRLWEQGIDTVRPRHRVEEGVKHLQTVVCDGQGKRRLHVHPRCTRFIEEMQVYVRDDNGRPIDANNHGCLVAGTSVFTATGPRPIETVQAGNLVLTRKGWRPVAWAGKTGDAVQTLRLETRDGRTLEGTPEHPVWVVGKGYTNLRNLQEGDTLTSFVKDSVLRLTERPGVRPVYNLTVEGEHEFFANGILVSNCDCARYLAWWRRTLDEKTEKAQQVGRAAIRPAPPRVRRF